MRNLKVAAAAVGLSGVIVALSTVGFASQIIDLTVWIAVESLKLVPKVYGA